MEDQVIENFLFALNRPIVQKPLSFGFDNPEVVHPRKMFLRLSGFGIRHGENEDAIFLQQPATIPERTVERKNRDMLEHVA